MCCTNEHWTSLWVYMCTTVLQLLLLVVLLAEMDNTTAPWIPEPKVGVHTWPYGVRVLCVLWTVASFTFWHSLDVHFEPIPTKWKACFAICVVDNWLFHYTRRYNATNNAVASCVTTALQHFYYVVLTMKDMTLILPNPAPVCKLYNWLFSMSITPTKCIISCQCSSHFHKAIKPWITAQHKQKQP